MPTFLRQSYQMALFGFLSVFAWWSIFGGILSIILIVTTFLAAVQASGIYTLSTLTNLDLSVLTSTPMFVYLEYYQYLWVILLVVVGIGSLIYTITVAQAEEGEIPIDFYQEVAVKAVRRLGIILVIWVIAGSVYLLFHYSKFISSQEWWANMTIIAQEGLRRLQMQESYGVIDFIFTRVYPYVPAPIYLLTYVWILRNSHTGWSGNVWFEPG